MSPAELADELGRALEEARAALEATDPIAASEATARAERCCQQAQQSQLNLPQADLDHLRELHGRCESAAAQLHTKIAASVLQAGTTRRAVDAYRGRAARTED